MASLDRMPIFLAGRRRAEDRPREVACRSTASGRRREGVRCLKTCKCVGVVSERGSRVSCASRGVFTRQLVPIPSFHLTAPSSSSQTQSPTHVTRYWVTFLTRRTAVMISIV